MLTYVLGASSQWLAAAAATATAARASSGSGRGGGDNLRLEGDGAPDHCRRVLATGGSFSFPQKNRCRIRLGEPLASSAAECSVRALSLI